MSLFRAISYDQLKEGELIQFFGVHMLSWGDIERATGIKPTIAFIEDDTPEKQNAELLKACKTVHRNLNKAWSGNTSGFEHALIATLELAIAKAEGGDRDEDEKDFSNVAFEPDGGDIPVELGSE